MTVKYIFFKRFIGSNFRRWRYGRRLYQKSVYTGL